MGNWNNSSFIRNNNFINNLTKTNNMKKYKEKKEPKEKKPKFYDVSQDTIDEVEKVLDKMSLPFKIKMKYIGVNKQNTLIKLQKSNPAVQYATDIDLFVFLNEDFANNLDESSVHILIHQELDKIVPDINKGTFKLGKFRFQTNEGIVNKYGIDAVARANQLSELYDKQSKDGQEFDVNSDDVKTKLKLNKKAGVEFN